ncbi:MAG: hypothetical protein HYR96_05680 [Deltaproteobacteria bacterium]|nr:hypothetical protein [Deltaproteobacteria bacterium]
MVGLHGILLIATGVVHIAFALSPAVYWKDWIGFSKRTFWNQVLITSDRSMAAFWFLLAGPLFVLLGMAIYEIEMSGGPLPKSIGVGLLMLGVGGAFMSPKSGFTVFILPQALFYLFSM